MCPLTELTVAQRVKVIAEMMISGQWGPLKSCDLAAVWGLEESAVRKHAAEASRLIVANMGDPTELKGRLVGMLEEALKCARDGALEDPLKAGKLIVDIVKQHAVLAGVNAPQKVALTDSKGDDIPPAVAAALSDPIVARLYLATNSMPTDAEVEAERARSGGLFFAIVLILADKLRLPYGRQESPLHRRSTRDLS